MSFVPTSSFVSRAKYDVFISHNREDTLGFTEQLLLACLKAGIIAFDHDYPRRPPDESIVPLSTGIETSKIVLIIFSRNYVSSSTCLDEVLKSLECKELYGQLVVPIFYGVNPSDVRKQTGPFENEFAKQEEKVSSEKLQQWKIALKNAANLSGWHYFPGLRSEALFVEEIINQIWRFLDRIDRIDDRSLIGVESYVETDASTTAVAQTPVAPGFQNQLEITVNETSIAPTGTSYNLITHRQRCALAMLLLMLEVISVILDFTGTGKLGFLLGAFLLSLCGFALTFYSCIKERTISAARQQAERQLGWVEVVFATAQLIATATHYSLAVLGIKHSYNASIYQLAFAIITVVFVLKNDANVTHSSHDALVIPSAGDSRTSNDSVLNSPETSVSS